MIQIFTSEKYKTETGQNLIIALQGLDAQCIYEGMKIGLKQPDWWYECWNLNDELVKLGILPKPISEYTDEDIGSIVSIPYNDESGKILLNNGCIEFEVVGVNHHNDMNDPLYVKPTITLMTKNIIRCAAFDAKEPTNLDSKVREYGYSRWSVSNIRQWLNSSGAANEWFTSKHVSDAAPTAEKVSDEIGAYADEPGFLTGFSPEVLQHFADIDNLTVTPLNSGISNHIEPTMDKVFLASHIEMGFKNAYGIDFMNEGTPLSGRYFDNNSRIKSGTYYGLYWTRSTNSRQEASVMCVDTDGTLRAINDPYNGSIGIAPLIVLH